MTQCLQKGQLNIAFNRQIQIWEEQRRSKQQRQYASLVHKKSFTKVTETSSPKSIKKSVCFTENPTENKSINASLRQVSRGQKQKRRQGHAGSTTKTNKNSSSSRSESPLVRSNLQQLTNISEDENSNSGSIGSFKGIPEEEETIEREMDLEMEMDDDDGDQVFENFEKPQSQTSSRTRSISNSSNSSILSSRSSSSSSYSNRNIKNRPIHPVKPHDESTENTISTSHLVNNNNSDSGSVPDLVSSDENNTTKRTFSSDSQDKNVGTEDFEMSQGHSHSRSQSGSQTAEELSEATTTNSIENGNEQEKKKKNTTLQRKPRVSSISERIESFRKLEQNSSSSQEKNYKIQRSTKSVDQSRRDFDNRKRERMYKEKNEDSMTDSPKSSISDKISKIEPEQAELEVVDNDPEPKSPRNQDDNNSILSNTDSTDRATLTNRIQYFDQISSLTGTTNPNSTNNSIKSTSGLPLSHVQDIVRNLDEQTQPVKRSKTLGDKPVNLSPAYRRKFAEKMGGSMKKKVPNVSRRFNRGQLDLEKIKDEKSPVLITKYRFKDSKFDLEEAKIEENNERETEKVTEPPKTTTNLKYSKTFVDPTRTNSKIGIGSVLTKAKNFEEPMKYSYRPVGVNIRRGYSMQVARRGRNREDKISSSDVNAQVNQWMEEYSQKSPIYRGLL